jgi:hypothetical protein
VAAFGEGERGGTDAQAAGLGGSDRQGKSESLLEDPQRLAWREEEGGGMSFGGATDAVLGVIGAQARPVGFLEALGVQERFAVGVSHAVLGVGLAGGGA